MAYNSSYPDGDEDAGLLDDRVRTNFEAIEDAVDVEHYFVTGGSQTGRHRFGRGTTAARNAITPQEGMIWFNTDAYAGHVVLQVYNSAAWVNVDVLQPTLFRTDAQTRATVPQYADWVTVPITGAGPYLVAVDFATSPLKYLVLTQNVLVSNPINDSLAGTAGTTIEFDIVQDATGGRTMTFANNYRTPGGFAPVISAGANTRTRLYISSNKDGSYLIHTSPDYRLVP